MDHPVLVEAYTMREAAVALGRTELTLRRWIEDDLVPGPILRDTSRGHLLYSVGELTVISRVLAIHEQEYSYYAASHYHTREQIMQGIHAYRAQSI